MKRAPIKMPVLSDTMKTGHLLGWKKQPGEAVKKGDVLAEIESDKAIMDLEAFSDGYLAGPLAEADSDIPVGQVIGYLTDSPESEAPKPEQPPEPTAATDREKPASAEPSTAPADQGNDAVTASAQIDTPSQPNMTPNEPTAQSSPARRMPASPYARGLARELGVDLAQLSPGPRGFIDSQQVLAAALQGPLPDLEAGPPFRYKLLTRMHRSVADNMSNTVHTPTFRVTAEMPVTEITVLAHDQKYSLTLLLARAAALTVTDEPRFNMAYTPMGLAVRDRVDVGIAVDMPGGLVTPVLRDAAGRDLPALNEDWRKLRDKARQQRLTPTEYQGATFYLSNLGMFPSVRSFDAIVPLGAAAILAVASARNGKALMTLTCDHRVVYGADAARFFEGLEKRLQNPEKLLD